MSELFITLSNVPLNKGSACLSGFVEIGSSRHIDDLDEIREFNSGRSMGVKDSRSTPGCKGCYRVGHSASRKGYRVLIVYILLLKKLIKSLLIQV